MKKWVLIVFVLFAFLSKAQTIPELQKKIQSQKNKDSLVILYDEIATLYSRKGEFDKAIDCQKKGLEVTKQIGGAQNLAFSYNNLGTVYLQSGNLNESIVYYTEALKVLEEGDFSAKAALVYTNIGHIYVKLKLYDKALDFYHKGLELKKKLGEKNILTNLYSISNVYRAQQNYKEAIKYLNETNNLIDTTNPAHAKQRTMLLNSLGACYRALEDYDKALHYYSISERLIQKTELDRLEPLYGNLAALYVSNGNPRQALSYQLKAFDCAKKINSLEGILISYQNFSEIYSQLKISDTAREYFKKYIDLSDSINKIQNAKYAIDLSTKYETEKKENQIILLAKDKELQDLKIIDQIIEIKNKEIETKRKGSEINLLNKDKDIKAIVLQQEIMNKQKKEKENKLLNVENLLSQQTIQQQKTISYFIISALILASGLAYFIFRGLKIQRSANKIILGQKQEVEHQKFLVEEKQKEIIDSINYAKRIQTTLMAHAD